MLHDRSLAEEAAQFILKSVKWVAFDRESRGVKQWTLHMEPNGNKTRVKNVGGLRGECAEACCVVMW